MALQNKPGKPACKIGGGYQTVTLSNGAAYTGPFKSCRPLPGSAHYQLGSTVLIGYAEPIDDHTARLKTETQEVTITLEIH